MYRIFKKIAEQVVVKTAYEQLKNPETQRKIVKTLTESDLAKKATQKAAKIAVEYTPPPGATGKMKDPTYYAGYKAGQQAKKIQRQVGEVGSESFEKAKQTSARVQSKIKSELDRRKR